MGVSCGVIEGNTYEQVQEVVQQALQVAPVRLARHGMVASDRCVALLMGETAAIRLALEAVQPERSDDSLLITRFICNPDRRCAGHFMKLIEEEKAANNQEGDLESPGARRRRWLTRLWKWKAA